MLKIALAPNDDISVHDMTIALLNYLASKQKNEDLIVYIKDIGIDKNSKTKEQDILDILAVFGIEYSHVVHQSQNIRFHTAMALQLLHEKKAFSCFCSDEWLKNKKEEAKKAKIPYIYDGACENLPAELVIDNENPFTVRIKKPNHNISLKDFVKDKIFLDKDEAESFIIMKQDKTPTGDFASAVDDMLNDISIVVCDEKNTKNTLKQQHIRKSLQYDKEIKYAHVSDVSGEVGIKKLLKDGYLPEAISNYLISTKIQITKEIFTLKEAESHFDLSNITNSPARFDIKKLNHINCKHLEMMQDKELSRYVGFADEDIGKLAKLYLKEVSTTKELKLKIKSVFAQKNIPDKYEKQFQIIKNIIKEAPHFEEFGDFESHILKKSSIGEDDVSQVLCYILTGTKSGPDIAKIYKYIKNYIGEIAK